MKAAQRDLVFSCASCLQVERIWFIADKRFEHTGAEEETGCRCPAPPLKAKKVCRFHGGKAGAPSGPSNGRYRHGGFTQAARVERMLARLMIRESRKLLSGIG